MLLKKVWKRLNLKGFWWILKIYLVLLILLILFFHQIPSIIYQKKCRKALQEMVRVCKSKENMFIQVDAYTTKEEKRNLDAWNLTALTAC